MTSHKSCEQVLATFLILWSARAKTILDDLEQWADADEVAECTKEMPKTHPEITGLEAQEFSFYHPIPQLMLSEWTK
ncbi:hypothetical protein TNCV_919551 [Trichonephila clavipes]|nr:hypothetical protein TNCV_919551 [Trichonephila clavipes]